MPRAKKGAARTKARNRTLKAAKGYVGGRHRLVRTAEETTRRALSFAYRDRRTKRRQMRRLWILRINAAARARGMKYSELINALAKANVSIDRKILADIAVNDPGAFGEIVELAKATV